MIVRDEEDEWLMSQSAESQGDDVQSLQYFNTLTGLSRKVRGDERLKKGTGT